MNIPTVLLVLAMIVYWVYSRRKKDGLINEWMQFAEEHRLEFDSEKSSLSGIYRNYQIWVGPEQFGKLIYSRFGPNGGLVFDTQILLTLQNPSRLKLQRATKVMLKGENELTTLLKDFPLLEGTLAELKAPNWVIRVQGKNLKYTQNGVEHDTTRLFNTLTILANLADVIEALPASDIIEIERPLEPLKPSFAYNHTVTILNTDPKKHPLSR